MDDETLRDKMLKTARAEANAKPKDSPNSGWSPSYKMFKYGEYGVDRNEDVAYAELAKIRKMLGMKSYD